MTTQTTELTYYNEPYRQNLEATVSRVESKGPLTLVWLNRTIFFPEGGGQPSDQGEIVGTNGRVRVEHARMSEGEVVHQGKLAGQLAPGDIVQITIKWSARHKNMRIHSAGHLLHDVLMGMVEGLIPTKGNHGQKAFLEYKGVLDPAIKPSLETKTNEALEQDIDVVTRYATAEEVTNTCRFVPPSLPKDKELRIIRIGSFDPMPDGGVQVAKTKEIGSVVIHDIAVRDGVTTIRYGVKGAGQEVA